MDTCEPTAWKRKWIQHMLVCATKASVFAKLASNIHEVIHLHITVLFWYE